MISDEAPASDGTAPDTQDFPESRHDGGGMVEESAEPEEEEDLLSYKATSKFNRYDEVFGAGFFTLLIDAKNALSMSWSILLHALGGVPTLEHLCALSLQSTPQE